MPREIIDTQSGRPGYVRRQILRTVILVAVVALALLLAYEVWTNKRANGEHSPTATPAAAPAHP
jgi:hypothetical protein